MPEVTITVSAGGQAATLTIPDESVQRLQPMVDTMFAAYAPDGASTMRKFIGGIRRLLMRELRKFETTGPWEEPPTNQAGAE